MIVLFLDFDGVLHRRPLGAQGEIFERLPALESLLREPAYRDVRIVISSSWSAAYPWEIILELFSPDLRERVVDRTPECGIPHGESRWAELQVWLATHPEVTRWVAVDDAREAFPPGMEARVVFTDPRTGLDDRSLRLLREALNRQFADSDYSQPLFLDTEFTDFQDPQLISLALVRGERELYVEIADFDRQQASIWTQANVLPLLEGGKCAMPREIAVTNVGGWIRALGGKLFLVTDLPHYDAHLLTAFLSDYWPDNLSRTPYKFDLTSFRSALADEATVAHRRAMNGKAAHHALNDARALQAAWCALEAVGWAPDVDHIELRRDREGL